MPNTNPQYPIPNTHLLPLWRRGSLIPKHGYFVRLNQGARGNQGQFMSAILNLNVRDASENKRRAFSPEK
jgi:hypothetical protein